jgi:alpha-ribazole phosphatase/probable phosphoglycerate mutase
VEERVISAMTDITKKYPDDSVLIVSHGVPLAVIICHAQGIPMDEVYEHIPENAIPYRVEWK